MLINFSVENYKCFLNKTSLSMLATLEKQHSQTIAKVAKFPLRILPISLIYGANASGKTAFFEAIQFLKSFVIYGVNSSKMGVPIIPFILNDEGVVRPSIFEITFLQDELVYKFSFTTDRKVILTETLIVINSSSEKLLYERKYNEKTYFDPQLELKHPRLQFVSESTLPNQLLLNATERLNLPIFSSVYNWFETLTTISTDSSLTSLWALANNAAEEDKYIAYNQALNMLDTGIECLVERNVEFEDLKLHSDKKNNIKESLEFTPCAAFSDDINNRYYAMDNNGKIIYKQLLAKHKIQDDKHIEFPLQLESDGTRRIIDLLPAFLENSFDNVEPRVIIIDEINRSLHSLLTRALIEKYLKNCGAEKRFQLILTNHDIMLMDQLLIRRDEMWITEKENGVSRLYSFSDFTEMRNDKDVRKSYIQGRLGGVPNILL